MIVLDDANLDLALEGALWGAFGTTGQRCTATSRIIVQKGVYSEFVNRSRRAREKAQGRQRPRRNRRHGSGGQQGPTGNRPEVHRDRQERRRQAALRRHIASTSGDYQYGWFLEPTVFGDVDPKMRIAQEEIFGPVVSIIPCDDIEHAIEIANGVEYGLSSALYTKDVNRAFKAMRDLYAGITYINAPTIGAEVHLPFGGTKQPATATAKAASAPSTSTPSGSRSTSTTPTSCRRRRSTARSSWVLK